MKTAKNCVHEPTTVKTTGFLENESLKLEKLNITEVWVVVCTL